VRGLVYEPEHLMAKRFTELRIDETPPSGPINDAPTPLRVRVRVRWNLDSDWTIIEDAWAMAWTTREVLVYWRTPGLDSPVTAWLKADQVQRAGPPPVS
jgi:hypothetical protein